MDTINNNIYFLKNFYLNKDVIDLENVVSVIIPVYNSEIYLSKCVKSVLSQTYKNIEIILVNDGSVDSSGLICDDFKKNNSNIIVVHTSNFGVSKARNTGIDICRGEYVLFIDSDDWIDNYMIEQLVKHIQKDKNKLAACGYFFENEQGLLIKKSLNQGLVELSRESVFNKFGSIPIPLWSIIFPNWLFKKKKIRFREDIFIAEDTLFIFECLVHVTGMIYDSTRFYHYLYRENSASHSDFNLKKLTAYKAYQLMIDITSKVSKNSINRVKSMIVSYTYIQILSVMKKKEDKKKYLKYFRKIISLYIIVYLNQDYVPLAAKIKIVLIYLFPNFTCLSRLIIKKISTF